MFEKKKSQYKSIFLSFIIVVLFAALIMAIGTNDVRINSPVNETWVNDTKFRFNFSWRDSVDPTIQYADCNLYIYNSSILNKTQLITDFYLFNETPRVGNHTNTSFTMNESFRANNSINWWTIECTNATATPTSNNNEPLAVLVDLNFPSVDNQSMNFTNNTWVKEGIRIEVLGTDDTNILRSRGRINTTLIYELRNATRVFASATVINGTPANLTNASMADGEYTTLTIRAIDEAGNRNISIFNWNVSIDQTLGTVSFNSPTPPDGDNFTDQTITFNFTITERNAEHVIFEFDGTNQSINITNSDWCNETAKPYSAPFYCNVTNSSIGAGRYSYRIYVNDSASNLVVSASRTFSIDLASPQFTDVFNWTVSDSLASFNFTIAETTPTSCRAKLYDRDGAITSTVAGTLTNLGGEGGASDTNCIGNFNSSDLNFTEGAFTVRFNASDGINESNETAVAGVLTRLYVGWNLITYLDGNRSVGDICSEVKNCTQVAWWNNTIPGKKAFVTFSKSTPSINNGTKILSGEGLHINVQVGSWIITNDNTPINQTPTAYNFTLSIPGWNVVGLLANTSINTSFNVEATNGSLGGGATDLDIANIGRNISFSSWFNASATKFLTCSRTLTKCAGTPSLPKNIELRKGFAVWMLPKNNITINRSDIRG